MDAGSLRAAALPEGASHSPGFTGGGSQRDRSRGAHPEVTQLLTCHIWVFGSEPPRLLCVQGGTEPASAWLRIKSPARVWEAGKS